MNFQIWLLEQKIIKTWRDAKKIPPKLQDRIRNRDLCKLGQRDLELYHLTAGRLNSFDLAKWETFISNRNNTLIQNVLFQGVKPYNSSYDFQRSKEIEQVLNDLGRYYPISCKLLYQYLIVNNGVITVRRNSFDQIRDEPDWDIYENPLTDSMTMKHALAAMKKCKPSREDYYNFPKPEIRKNGSTPRLTIAEIIKENRNASRTTKSRIYPKEQRRERDQYSKVCEDKNTNIDIGTECSQVVSTPAENIKVSKSPVTSQDYETTKDYPEVNFASYYYSEFAGQNVTTSEDVLSGSAIDDNENIKVIEIENKTDDLIGEDGGSLPWKECVSGIIIDANPTSKLIIENSKNRSFRTSVHRSWSRVLGIADNCKQSLGLNKNKIKQEKELDEGATCDQKSIDDSHAPVIGEIVGQNSDKDSVIDVVLTAEDIETVCKRYYSLISSQHKTYTGLSMNQNEVTSISSSTSLAISSDDLDLPLFTGTLRGELQNIDIIREIPVSTLVIGSNENLENTENESPILPLVIRKDENIEHDDENPILPLVIVKTTENLENVNVIDNGSAILPKVDKYEAENSYNNIGTIKSINPDMFEPYFYEIKNAHKSNVGKSLEPPSNELEKEAIEYTCSSIYSSDTDYVQSVAFEKSSPETEVAKYPVDFAETTQVITRKPVDPCTENENSSINPPMEVSESTIVPSVLSFDKPGFRKITIDVHTCHEASGCEPFEPFDLDKDCSHDNSDLHLSFEVSQVFKEIESPRPLTPQKKIVEIPIPSDTDFWNKSSIELGGLAKEPYICANNIPKDVVNSLEFDDFFCVQRLFVEIIPCDELHVNIKYSGETQHHQRRIGEKLFKVLNLFELSTVGSFEDVCETSHTDKEGLKLKEEFPYRIWNIPSEHDGYISWAYKGHNEAEKEEIGKKLKKILGGYKTRTFLDKV